MAVQVSLFATCVVDQDRNRTQCTCDFISDAFGIGVQSDVPEGANRLNTVRLADLFCRVGQRRTFAKLRRPVLAHPVNANVASHRCQPFGECPTQTAASPGHQRNFSR